MSQNADVEDGIRYVIKYDGHKLYVTVSHSAREIFISSIFDNKVSKLAAMCDSLTRMVTMAWQHEDTEDIIKQLLRSSRSSFDLPGMIAELLTEREGDE